MMKINNVKGIIWDLDGTLIDSFGIFEEVIADIVNEKGYTMPSRDEILRNYHGSLEDTIQNILGLESASELNEVVTFFLEKQQAHYASDLDTHLFTDAATLAQNSAKEGISQLLVTNRAHAGRGLASPKAIIAATVLADCIHEILPGDEVEYRKPDKRSVTEWIAKHQFKPEEIVVIGDQFVDAQLALNIGAHAILIERDSTIPHLEKLEHDNPESITIVDSLEGITLNRL